MFIYAPYEGAKGIAVALGATDKMADYLGAAQVSANLLAIATGIILAFKQKPLEMPRGTKGLLIYSVIALPVLLYCIEIYATREGNAFMKFDSPWYLLLLLTPMNPIFPPFALLAALDAIAREFYGEPVAAKSAGDA